MASNLSMAMSEVTKLCNLLLIILRSVSVQQSFSAVKMVCTYLCSTQIQERLTRLLLMTFEKNILQDLGKGQTPLTEKIFSLKELVMWK
jgi:hypothetical protein